jgi:DNA invertase Pin-like site-specific DNA recombinase
MRKFQGNYKDHTEDISRIINYLRRSRQDVEREKRTGEDTLSAQKKLMKNVLDSYGIPYVQKEEIGSGDKISTRPVFIEVIEELKENKYDAIAVKEISRLGRGSYSDMALIYDLLKDKRLYVITPYRIYDCTNESDLKQIRFELFMSREEFETTRERLTTARYNSALEGKWMGNIPFGYRRNKNTMFLEPVEEEAEVIKLIYNLYLNGYEGKQVKEKAIATILKDHGIKTAKNCTEWDSTQIKRYLTNDAYIGVSKFRTTKRNSDGKIEVRPEEEHIIVEDAHPYIISPEDFERVQEMKRSKRKTSRKDAEIFALSGIITCKKCGRKAVVNRYKRKRQSGDYYDIYIKCNVGSCLSVKYQFAEEAILKLLKRLQDAPAEELLKMYKEQVKAEKAEEVHVSKAELETHMKKELEKRRKKVEERLDFIGEKHFDGTYTDETFNKFQAKLLTELEEIKHLEENEGAQETASAEETLQYDSKLIKNNLIKVIDVYESNASNDEKNELLKSMICKLEIEVTKAGTKKDKPEMNLDVILTNRIWEEEV